jgi:hypothetical protein
MAAERRINGGNGVASKGGGINNINQRKWWMMKKKRKTIRREEIAALKWPAARHSCGSVISLWLASNHHGEEEKCVAAAARRGAGIGNGYRWRHGGNRKTMRQRTAAINEEEMEKYLAKSGEGGKNIDND